VISSFDRLLAIGYLGAVPSPRDQPFVVPAVLYLPESEEVLLPPFVILGADLHKVEGSMSSEEFVELSTDGNATVTLGEPIPARPDGCFYLPEGSGPAEYLSMKDAAAKLVAFADEKIRWGDEFFAANKHVEALACYELAAAAAQRPEDYAKMLREVRPDAELREALLALAHRWETEHRKGKDAELGSRTLRHCASEIRRTLKEIAEASPTGLPMSERRRRRIQASYDQTSKGKP
jgi:hypothetical protein